MTAIEADVAVSGSGQETVPLTTTRAEDSQLDYNVRTVTPIEKRFGNRGYFSQESKETSGFRVISY